VGGDVLWTPLFTVRAAGLRQCVPVQDLMNLGFENMVLLLSAYSNPVETIEHARRLGYRVTDFMVTPLPFGYYSSEPKVRALRTKLHTCFCSGYGATHCVPRCKLLSCEGAATACNGKPAACSVQRAGAAAAFLRLMCGWVETFGGRHAQKGWCILVVTYWLELTSFRARPGAQVD
jgi:hypothetical protein